MATRVPIEPLLVGGEAGIPAAKYARITDDLLRPSRTIAESPHVALLKKYKIMGAGVLEKDTFEKSAYFLNAATSIDLVGSYFGIVDPARIVDKATDFIAHFEGHDRMDGECTSSPREPIILRRIKWSNGKYEIDDGKHRCAIAYVKGDQHISGFVLSAPPVSTPVQDLILDSVWTRGQLELYQPLDLPEFGSDWSLIRKCSDRLGYMLQYLQSANLTAQNGPYSYIDLGSNYGWFVKEMQEKGFASKGVEKDPASVSIAKLVFGIEDSSLYETDLVRFLESNVEKYDIVSCFSVLHHFILGKGRVSGEELLRRISEITERVLFLDTGEEHEAWFKKSLAGWNADFIAGWLQEHGGFSRVIKLGRDEDMVGKYKNNYGRTLFACIK